MSWTLLDRPVTRRDPFATLFGEFFRMPRVAPPSTVMPVNGWVGADEAVLVFEVPGFAPEDLKLSIDGEQLVVSAERKPRAPAENETQHRRERAVGSFERRIGLSFRVDPDKVEARYENGLLHVRLPRAAEDRPRKITVRTA